VRRRTGATTLGRCIRLIGSPRVVKSAGVGIDGQVYRGAISAGPVAKSLKDLAKGSPMMFAFKGPRSSKCPAFSQQTLTGTG
jgi:hypothetical protein